MSSKYLAIMALFLLATLGACGSGQEIQDNLVQSPIASEYGTYAVTSAADLPACDSTTMGRLYYLETEASFKVCKVSGWATITVGQTIISNKVINPYTTNMCTQFTGDFCVFNGGQIVKYSDGSVLILGAWSYAFEIAGDTDIDQQTISYLVPPTQVTGSYSRLSGFVARGSGYKAMYLVYTRSGDALSLVHDTNGSSTVDTGDTTITTLSTTTW